MSNREQVVAELEDRIREWLPKPGGSRSTVAAGLAVLDHLAEKCPLAPEDVLSDQDEVRGARGGALRALLEKHGEHRRLLADGATTRASSGQALKLLEALDYGRPIAHLKAREREAAVRCLIAIVMQWIDDWFQRERLELSFDPELSPGSWVKTLLEAARAKSGGKVEQHLVGAKLERRHPDHDIAVLPSSAGDAQTGRPGDFVVGSTAYHVTAAPGRPVIEKCAANLRAGYHPVLLVPQENVERTKGMAEGEGIADRITIASLEDFVAVNIIEMSAGEKSRFLATLNDILAAYNRRIAEVETDQSLRVTILNL